MSLIAISIAHRIFDQSYFDSFIRFVLQPFIDSSSIRIEIKFVQIDLVSIFDVTQRIRLRTVDDIDHLAYTYVLREDAVDYPYNRIISAFSDMVHSIFVLQLYFAEPHETVQELTLFFGLNAQNNIVAVKELCWNEKKHRCFEIHTMQFAFNVYMRELYEPTKLKINQAS